MMLLRNIVFTILLILLAFTSCKAGKKSADAQAMTLPLPAAAVAQTVIYKTTRNFDQLVPVVMNENRTEIVSYPAPSDLKHGDELMLPTPLIEGYLLDNRGIHPNTAFISYTYEEYAALPEAPSLETLMSRIVERYPLVELYFCGKRESYPSVERLNKLIEGGFVGCRKADIVVVRRKYSE